MIIFIASGLFIILFYWSFLRSDLLQRERSTLVHEAQLAAQSLSYVEANLIVSEGDRLAFELSERVQARVTIIQHDGKVLGDSSQPASQMENHSDRPEFQQALKGQVGIMERYSLTEGMNYLYVAVPVENQLPVRTVFRLSLPSATLWATLSTIEKWLWISFGLGFTLFLMLATLFFRFLNYPLRKIVRTFQKAEAENPPVLRFSQRDEVGELVKFYNIQVERSAELAHKLKALQSKLQFAQQGESGFLTLNKSFQVISATPRALEILGIPGRRLFERTLIESALSHDLDEGVRQALKSGNEQLIRYSGKALILKGQLLDLSQEEWALISIQDQTELEILRRVHRDFLANLSHELRTPLSSIKAILETISQEPPPAGKIRIEFLKKALKEIDYLSSLLQSLSKLYLVESGKMEFHPENFDLCELLIEIKDSLEDRATQLGLLFELQIPEGSIFVQADRLHLREAFLAIIDNSFKFTPRGRQVSIQALSREGWVTISFRDQGIGISREDLPRIFERFYKSDKGRGTGGFGIGLSLAKLIIENFAGTLTVVSDEGKGALFIVRMPVLGSEGKTSEET